MKKAYTHLLCAIGIQLVGVGISQAQPNTLVLKSPTSPVIIDGDRKEWGDSLSYYNPENKINYTLANDKQNIYLVIKTIDVEQQANILNAGLTFSIDTKGRKKTTFSTTFPVGGQATRRPGKPTLEENMLKAQYASLRKIKVDGFKDISEDEIPTDNGYGIKTALNYDQQGTLVYEQAIPIDLFRAGDLAKGEWAFNIKLIPPIGGGMGGGRSGGGGAPGGFTGTTGEIVTVSSGGGGRRGPGGLQPHIQAATIDKVSPVAPEVKPIEFWGKLSLAQ